MKSYTGLIPKYLKKQSRRSILTIMGIVLSIALITSIGIFAESARFNSIENTKKNYGSHHASFNIIDSRQLSILQNHAQLEKLGIVTAIGGCNADRTMPIVIGSWNADMHDILKLSMSSGRLPLNKNEIAMEEAVLSKLNIKPELGCEISLDVNVFGEKGGSARKLTFKLVGIYKNFSFLGSGTGSSFGIVTDETSFSLVVRSQAKFNAFIQIKDGLPIQDSVKNIEKELGSEANLNWMLLNALGEGNDTGNGDKIAVIILGAIIIISTIAGIYNAFHISVLERVKQFGILRSIGTTPKQARRIVLGEALLLSAISIPLGIGFGTAAPMLLLRVFSTLFGNISRVIVPPYILIAAAAVGFAAVLISAFNPARLAGGVSPVEAILTNSKVVRQSSVKHRRWHWLIQAVSGISGKMAYRSLWRNKKRFLITVFSLCIGVVLFIVFSYYVSIVDTLERESYISSDFQLGTNAMSNNGDIGYPAGIYNEIIDIPGIKKVVGMQLAYIETMFSGSRISEEIKAPMKEKKTLNKAVTSYDAGTDIFGVNTSMIAYDDNTLRIISDYLAEGDVDVDKMSREPEVLVLDTWSGQSGEKILKNMLKVGDEIQLRMMSGQVYEPGKAPIPEYRTIKARVGGILKKLPVNTYWTHSEMVVMTHRNIFKGFIKSENYQVFSIDAVEKSDSKLIKSRLETISRRIRFGTFTSYEEQVEEMKDMKNQIMIFYYGLIGIISLIAVFNIINTVSSNIILRTREFGTLRAIGMTGGQLKLMVRIEGIIYGIMSSLWGCTIGCILAYVLYNVIKSDNHAIEWAIPWQAILTALIINILVGILASIMPVRRISSMNVLESIRAID